VSVRVGGAPAGAATADPVVSTADSPWRVVAREHGRRDGAVRRLLAASDACGVAVGLVVSLGIASPHPAQLAWGFLTLPAWIVVLKAYGLYDRDIKRIGHMSLDDLPWVVHAVLVGSLLTFAYYEFTPTDGIVVFELAVFAATATVSVLVLRALARRLALRLLGPERLLLVGEADELALLARKMSAHPEYGVAPVASVSSGRSKLDLPGLVAEHGIERLVVCPRDFGEPELLEMLRRCRSLRVKLSVLPDLFDALGPSVEIDDVEGVTVLGINPPVLPRSSRLLKRAMDVAGAAAGLVLTAPLFIVIAAAIKLDSRGPVLFRQDRIGRAGHRFRLAKFRTMCADAEKRHAELLKLSRDPSWLALDCDPRVTRVGRLLRHSSLDELPQLWNVLIGEMSLVGPRPLIESEDRQLEGWRRTRIDLTPGLTGLWQVLGRTNIPFDEMIKLDYVYVTNWSLWTDVRLILRTLPALLSRRGAN
jgi:exopolysaccharide biosynthesis polyprenyl glycosylphosphotransferase